VERKEARVFVALESYVMFSTGVQSTTRGKAPRKSQKSKKSSFLKNLRFGEKKGGLPPPL
jgi:hypothetical protein